MTGRRPLTIPLVGAVALASALVGGACGGGGGTETSRECVGPSGSEVCAWREGAVQLTTEGLRPGSDFSYVVTPQDGEAFESDGLRVGDDGTVPGATGILTPAGGVVTLDITAVAADGSPIVGQIVVD